MKIDKPNILVILIDDLGYGDLGCYGNTLIRTPNLDKLASQGIRLTDCYSAGPMCSPSRAALLTGRDPNRIGVYDWIPPDHFMHMPSDEITLAQLLQDADFQTCHVGKWHLSWIKEEPEQPQPHDYGFEYWFSSQTNHGHRNPSDFFCNGSPMGELKGYSCQIVTDEAIRWLAEEREEDRPFFQFVCYHEPHEPIQPPSDLLEEYANYGAKAPYYACVTHLDMAIGRFMDGLEEMDLAKNTLLIFTVDHGPARWHHRSFMLSHGSAGPLLGFKRYLWEGGIRVPGIIRWPSRIEEGQVINHPIGGVDWMPTICSLLDIDIPDDRIIDGCDAQAIFRNSLPMRNIPLHWEFHHPWGGPQAVLRDGPWVVTAQLDSNYPYLGGFKREFQPSFKNAELIDFKLYNLADDIGQTTDLSDRYQERTQTMGEQLQGLYREVHDEGPVW